MSDKLYTAYGEDKILDLENENVTDALKDAVGGGGDSPITYVYYTDPEEYGQPMTCDKTYEEIKKLFTDHMPMIAIYDGNIYNAVNINGSDCLCFYFTNIRINSNATALDGNFYTIYHYADGTISSSQLYGSIDADIVID